MADVFVSYARADRERVAPLVRALESEGWSVWWDPEIAPGQEFDRLIAEELNRARAAVVVWTPTSVNSRWVRGEARVAADRGVLAPVRFEGAELPIDLRAIHTTDLDNWGEDAAGSAFRELTRAVRALLGEAGSADKPSKARARSICVLPFANISGDPEQEYFSDGISEDIITDLSKVSALAVASRNSAFAFKGKALPIAQVARDLGVSHILEGSVRKAGNRVRITAQLIEAASDTHLWAERWDRDLADIFALQDEISQAVVTALKVKLLPEEKSAIEKRGTDNVEAYGLYLMARRYFRIGAASRNELIIRLCRRAVDLDGAYAQPWALMALALSLRAVQQPGKADESLAAADTAIRLDATLAEAHAAKGRSLAYQNHFPEAEEEITLALRLDPTSQDANHSAGILAFLTERHAEAAAYFEAAARANEHDNTALIMALSCHQAVGDAAAAERAAKAALRIAEKEIAAEPGEGNIYAKGVTALAFLGEAERARIWADRALLLDPEDWRMQFNLCCSMIRLGELDTAMDYLEDCLGHSGEVQFLWAKRDADLEPLHGLDRFKAIMAAAEARHAAVKSATGG